jgi:hypothetical protein
MDLSEKVQIIEIKQYVQSDEVPKEVNPDMVTKEACPQCAELHAWAWDGDSNIKAMFDSIRLRKSRQEQPKKPA